MPEQDADLIALKARFHQDMLDTYQLLKSKYHYNAFYFSQMLLDYSGVGTPRRLLGMYDSSDSFMTL